MIYSLFPGSPFQQIIGDSASIEASGDGLIRAEQDKTATFFVNTGGAKGDLFVQVDGRWRHILMTILFDITLVNISEYLCKYDRTVMCDERFFCWMM